MDLKVFCIECNRYFENKEYFDKEHNNAIYQVMNIKHNCLEGKYYLGYISHLFSNNDKIMEYINKQNNQIHELKSKVDYYEEAFKNDVHFDCNINVKHIENKIDGKCLIHFFPKIIFFRIECNDNIIFQSKKEFEIDILFPFKKSIITMGSIEKIQGCVSNQTVLNSSEQETLIYNNYSPSIYQKNSITSIKLLRNYYSTGYLEKNKINIIINGLLTFDSFKYDFNLPFVLYNITEKKFICYDNYKWRFSDNCFSEDGNINNNFIITIELNEKLKEIYIKNKYRYLGNKQDFTSTDKNEAKYIFNFINKFYGIITIENNGLFLSTDETGLIKLTKEENYFLIYNIDLKDSQY